MTREGALVCAGIDPEEACTLDALQASQVSHLLLILNFG